MAHDIATKTRNSEKPGIAESKPSASVLVVDDDVLVLDLLSEYLKSNGYDVLTANSGEEALSKIRSARMDLALVDLKMPGMDGLETIEKIAENDPEAVTILMTGYPTIDSSVKAIKLGASNYIMKPFKLEEVGLAVEKGVRERNVRREMKNLKRRISELEKGIEEKKESFKINQKVDSNKKIDRVNTSEGYSARSTHSHSTPANNQE